MSVGGKKTCT